MCVCFSVASDFPFVEVAVNENNVISHRYGDLFSIDAGVFRQVMVRDLDLLRDMLARDAFSGRGKITVMGLDIFSILRGGHGGHGLVHSEGNLCTPHINIFINDKKKLRTSFMDGVLAVGCHSFNQCQATSGESKGGSP